MPPRGKKAAPKTKKEAPADDDQQDEQEIVSILDARPAKKKREFLVKYKGSDKEEWLPENKVGKDLIEAYQNEQKEKKSKGRKIVGEKAEEFAKIESARKAKHEHSPAQVFLDSHACCPDCIERSLISALEINDTKKIREVLHLVRKKAEEEFHKSNKGKKFETNRGLIKSETFKDSLQIAAEYGNVDIVKVLVEEYPDNNMQEAIESCFEYPLSKDILAFFLSPDTIANAQVRFISCFQRAMSHGQVNNLAFMIEKTLANEKANSDIDKSGLTPLHLSALTATSEKDLKGTLDEETTNVGAFPPKENYSVNQHQQFGAFGGRGRHRGLHNQGPESLFVTPVHLAALNPNPRILKHLIEAGGDITILDDNGLSVLQYASVSPDGPEYSKYALSNEELGLGKSKKKEKKKPKKEEDEEEEEEEAQTGKKRRKGRSPSPRRAAIKEEPQELEELPDLIEGCSPTLVYVLALSQLETATLASYHYNQSDWEMALKAHRTYNVLAIAQFHQHLPVEPNTNIDALMSLLESAIMYGNIVLVGKLLQEEPIFAKFLKDPFHALELAIINKKDLIFDLLAATGCKLTNVTDENETLLWHAIAENSLYFAKRLVEEYKFSVTDKNLQGDTTLLRAVEHGLVDFAEYLISKGADPNSINEDGVSVLMGATRAGHKSCVELLVKKGVDVNALISAEPEPEAPKEPEVKDDDDAEPMEADLVEKPAEDTKMAEAVEKVTTTVLHDLMKHCKSDWGRFETASYLLSVGGSVFSEDSDGVTPLYLMVSLSQTDASVALLDLFLEKAGKRAAELVNKKVNGTNALLLAHNKDRFVQRMLAVQGVDVNAKTENEDETSEQDDGFTLLHYLYNNTNQIDLIKKVIELGGDINAVTRNGVPVLHQYTGYMDTLAYLVTVKHVNINIKNKQGQNIVHMLLQNGWQDPIETLITITEKAPSLNLGEKDNYGYTPLHYAARNQNMHASLRYLIKRGAPVDVENQDGNTALALALMTHSPAQCITLIEAGADVNRKLNRNQKPTTDQTNAFGSNGFGSKGKKKSKGLNLLSSDDNSNKISFFKSALDNHNLKSVLFVLLESEKLDYVSALGDAITSANVMLAEKLMERAAAKMSPTKLASSPLFHSLFSSNTTSSDDQIISFIDKLVSYKIPLNTKDAEGYTPLHCAVINGYDTKIIEHLLKSGAEESVTIPTNKGVTVLHSAIMNNNAEVVELLLKNHKKLVTVADGSGNTPLHYAVLPSFGTFSNSSLIVTLAQNGGSLSAKNKDGKTPAFLAGTVSDTALESVRAAINSVKLDPAEAKEIEQQFTSGKEERLAKQKEFETKRKARAAKIASAIADLEKTREKLRKKRQEQVESEKEFRKKNAHLFKVPVDQACFQNYQYKVYVEGEDIYDVMLNQTDVSFGTYGHNKFYVLQLLKYTGETQKNKKNVKAKKNRGTKPYRTINRWGRVGDYGQHKVQDFDDLASAKADFKKKFAEKTKNKWEARQNFVKYPNKYDIVELFYDIEKPEQETAADVPSKLSPKLQDFMSVITDLEGIRRSINSYGLDWRRMPLGRLSTSQIQTGYDILKKIEKALKEKAQIDALRGRRHEERRNEIGALDKKLTTYTNEFYTLIPADTGRGLPPTINNFPLLTEKVQMLDAMQEIEEATNLLLEIQDVKRNPLDVWYDQLGCDLKELSAEDPQHKMIQTYINQGKDGQHPVLYAAYKVRRWPEVARFEPHRKDNVKLLWHGSPASNFIGILSQGLRIAPPEAPATGYMFGKGIYFADAWAKSAGYCRSYGEGVACMLLAQVALGEPYKRKHSEYVEKLPPKKGSTMGCGRHAPAKEGDLVTAKGVTIPLGRLEEVKEEDLYLNYNEYIVYDPARVKIKYVVLLKV